MRGRGGPASLPTRAAGAATSSPPPPRWIGSNFDVGSYKNSRDFSYHEKNSMMRSKSHTQTNPFRPGTSNSTIELHCLVKISCNCRRNLASMSTCETSKKRSARLKFSIRLLEFLSPPPQKKTSSVCLEKICRKSNRRSASKRITC